MWTPSARGRPTDGVDGLAKATISTRWRRVEPNGGENTTVCGRNVSEILKYSFTYTPQALENNLKNIQRPVKIVNATEHNLNDPFIFEIRKTI